MVNYKLFISFKYSDLQKRIKESELEFEEKQKNIFGNLNVKYGSLLKYFLISLKIDTPINLSFIFKNVHFSKNNDRSNEPNNLENSFINKKTKRNAEKNEINEEIQEIKNKNKIFSIKKVKEKKKEMEKEIKSMSIYRKSKFRGVLRKGKGWQAFIMINRNKNYIGNFKTEEEAAKVYDEYAMKFHKNKARLNFPHKGYINA